MARTIYQVEISREDAYINEITTSGTVISSQCVSPSEARSFACCRGLSLMDWDDDTQYYW